MNMMLLFKEDVVSGSTVEIRGRRHSHIVKVLKKSFGAELCIGMLEGKIGKGIITKQTKTKTSLEITLSKKPVPKNSVTLLLCLCRPPVLRRVIYTATILGVKEIYIMNSNRVEKSFWSSHALKQEQIKEQIYLGLEQTVDTVMPKIYMKRSFKEFMLKDIKKVIKNKKSILLEPSAKNDCPYNAKKPVVIAIGPEGGFVEYEIKAFKDVGFSQYGLGKRIQRVETVVPYIMGRLF
jgi:RsmE family RNA methyltransferase